MALLMFATLGTATAQEAGWEIDWCPEGTMAYIGTFDGIDFAKCIPNPTDPTKVIEPEPVPPTNPLHVAIALPIAIFITYLVYKFNLLGDGTGEVGTRQPDSDIEKWFDRNVNN